jgi:hypothetical protein
MTSWPDLDQIEPRLNRAMCNVRARFRESQWRGDRKIWFIHPYVYLRYRVG